jgi:tryptophanyl-tRNA synthetase
MMMAKKRVLSGIRATGRLHLGNYLGAVKGMLALQEDSEYETLYTVVDLHTMTTPYDAKTLASSSREVVLDYLSCGLDPEKSMIFVQSHLADLHAQLMFYFSTVTSVARMKHLPTYKDKVKQHPKDVTMALLNYPVLMAADILIYRASAVPVGDDQLPHLEVAREIARKMNQKYGLDFPEPEQFRTEGFYVPSLTGEGKMSKSVKGSYINLTDDLATINKKLAAVPTDSGKGSEVPSKGGVANLLTFVELYQGKKKRAEYEKAYKGEGIRYKQLKEQLAEAIYEELKPIQEKRKELKDQPDYVERVIKDGAERARKIAERTIKEVKGKMGLKQAI